MLSPSKSKPTARRKSAPALPLCPYQERWIADASRFKIAVKSRRIGFTFATTLEIMLDAISRRTRWLIISRTQDTAKEALREVANHLNAFRAANVSEREREEDTDLFLDGARITKFIITLPNGSEITAMTAHPDAARGFGGNVFLDEHAFHRDSEELWKGAAASVMRGHRLIVVSTPHYQIGNFYRLAREANLINGSSPLSAVIPSTAEGSAFSPEVAHHPTLKAGPSSRLLPSAGSGQALGMTSLTGNAVIPNESEGPAFRASSGIWSPHWIDIHTAAPQLSAIGVPGFENVDKALADLRQLAGDDETWNQFDDSAAQALLDRAPEALDTAAESATAWALTTFERAVKDNLSSSGGSSIGGGTLADAIYSQLKDRPEIGGIVDVHPPADSYAVPIEYGAVPHLPPVEALFGWVRHKLGASDQKAVEQVAWAVAKAIEKRGLPGLHMFERAFAAYQDQIVARFNAEIRQAAETL